MSIKAYAVANKISIYSVVKMAKNGTLKTQTQKVEGKDELFILLDETKQVHVPLDAGLGDEKAEDCQKAYLKLKIKYDQLQMKYDTLRKTLSKEA